MRPDQRGRKAAQRVGLAFLCTVTWILFSFLRATRPTAQVSPILEVSQP
jgi:hypothetical protein